mmetsp:Transcript_16584/g.30111  ORF Transcript_16584/g.30111 Transcript_16584/m.30111 type:complete len:202 (-) Transcript_16584:384-989(-)
MGELIIIIFLFFFENIQASITAASTRRIGINIIINPCQSYTIDIVQPTTTHGTQFHQRVHRIIKQFLFRLHHKSWILPHRFGNIDNIIVRHIRSILTFIVRSGSFGIIHAPRSLTLVIMVVTNALKQIMLWKRPMNIPFDRFQHGPQPAQRPVIIPTSAAAAETFTTIRKVSGTVQIMHLSIFLLGLLHQCIVLSRVFIHD